MGPIVPALGGAAVRAYRQAGALLGLRKKNRIHKIFSDAELARLKRATGEAERNTSGEIRVCIVMDYRLGIRSAEAQAKHEFLKYGMNKTEERSGVLILLVWEKRQFYIYADEGIYTLLTPAYLNRHAVDLAMNFRKSNFVDALILAVSDIGRELAQYFPRRPDDRDELPDDVILEDE